MVESDVGKLATPLGGDTATETQGQQLVAKVLPELEAAIGEFPHAVDTVGAIRFTKDIVEEQSLKSEEKKIYIKKTRLIF